MNAVSQTRYDAKRHTLLLQDPINPRLRLDLDYGLQTRKLRIKMLP